MKLPGFVFHSETLEVGRPPVRWGNALWASSSLFFFLKSTYLCFQSFSFSLIDTLLPAPAPRGSAVAWSSGVPVPTALARGALRARRPGEERARMRTL